MPSCQCSTLAFCKWNEEFNEGPGLQLIQYIQVSFFFEIRRNNLYIVWIKTMPRMSLSRASVSASYHVPYFLLARFTFLTLKQRKDRDPGTFFSACRLSLIFVHGIWNWDQCTLVWPICPVQVGVFGSGPGKLLSFPIEITGVSKRG